MGKFLLVYALIPFIGCIPGFVLSLAGLPQANIIVVPITVMVIYHLMRKKNDTSFAARCNGLIACVLLLVFTIMMILASGNVQSQLMFQYSWLILPFAPIMLIHLLMNQFVLLYVTAMISYAGACAFLSLREQMSLKKFILPAVMAIVCIGISTFFYINRPNVRYAGHGFDYMNGFSSTDFKDYMVYSNPSKLVEPDEKPDFCIEKEAQMPIMDGAEACYPLYAAFAKAVYKDIDKIEVKWMKESGDTYYNGKIVTFTNSVNGFDRLLDGADKDSDYGIDLFFGARPSTSQLEEAENVGVDLEITPIGREAFVFFVEADNPVENLTSEQVKAIYHGDITDWSELGGKNQKILAFQRPENSGSQTMMQYFMGDVSLKEPQTYETVSAMDGVIRQVAQYHNEDGAIGYSFRYFLEELNQEKGVHMVSIDGIEPSVENIENGTYPLTTNVCLITRKNDPNPNVKKMIDFILSEEGQKMVRKTGYGGVE